MTSDQTPSIEWRNRNVPEMKELIVQEYYSFAIGMAKTKIKKLPRCVDADSLESAALAGLLDSIRTFEPDKGCSFKTFAGHRIRGAIMDALRKDDHLSRGARRVALKRRDCEAELTQSLGRKPTPDEVLVESDLTSKQLALAVAKPIDIESEQARFKKVRFADPSVDTSFFRSDAFRNLLRGLCLENQTILYLYYFRGASMKHIGEAMGLSESRISQIHSDLLERIRSLGRERFVNRM